MKILLTGATGYIGKRLLPKLIEQGHHVVCLVRDGNRFDPPESLMPNLSLLEADLLDPSSLINLPSDIDAAYYLVHSMSNADNYAQLEQESAINFRKAIECTQAKQVIYLGGIINESDLSDHLQSRKQVDIELSQGKYHLTSLRAGIIVGSGSASFEIMRDLVEKLPVMITPKWLITQCQPIAIIDVIKILTKVLNNQMSYDQAFDIGGPDVLTYKEMLLTFAKVRGLKRYIFTVPVMTPRLSSYWLYFVTATSYKLAKSLVDSMKVEVICRDQRINEILNMEPVCYEEALKNAFVRIQKEDIISTWKDSYVSSDNTFNTSDFIEVPQHGCFRDSRSLTYLQRQPCIDSIWAIGGNNGWYHGNILWKLRGYLDKLFGGVGLRRGRRHPSELIVGDALDFWRVLHADKEKGHLLLFAEMKLPGEAWLEFKIKGDSLIQTATFRPLGIAGRLYWFSVLPMHGYIFNGMLKKLTRIKAG